MEIAPSTGFAPLDDALGGVYWGDNVVWEATRSEMLAPFITAAAAARDPYESATWVSFGQRPSRHRGFGVIDAGPSTALAQPRAVLEQLREVCGDESRHLVVFDPLELLEERWGARSSPRRSSCMRARCCSGWAPSHTGS